MSDSSVTPVPVGDENWQSKNRTVVSRTSVLHNSPEFSDVQFIFIKNEDMEGTTIFGHKLILAMASPIFSKMFFGQNQQFTTDVESRMDMSHHSFTAAAFSTFIKESAGSAIECFDRQLRNNGLICVQFLYTDKIYYAELSTEVILGVLKCADYYDVPYLKRSCVNQLELLVTKENAIQILETADLFREKDLTREALELIDQNSEFVFESEEILSVKMETLDLILKRDSLDMEECFILDLAMKWAGMECERKNREPTAQNKREVLGKVFFEIRFGLLTSNKISELVSTNFLTKDESLDILLASHTPGYVTAAGNSELKRRRLSPEIGLKSNPRIFGRKKKLMEVDEMEKKWRVAFVKRMSLAKGRADLLVLGDPLNCWYEKKLREKIEEARGTCIFDLEVKKLYAASFRVQFKYNSSKYAMTHLCDPKWYGFDESIQIRISEWNDPSGGPSSRHE